MSGLKQRVNKLYQGSISDVTSVIVVKKNDEVIKKKSFGTNKNKVIELAIRF